MLSPSVAVTVAAFRSTSLMRMAVALTLGSVPLGRTRGHGRRFIFKLSLLLANCPAGPAGPGPPGGERFRSGSASVSAPGNAAGRGPRRGPGSASGPLGVVGVAAAAARSSWPKSAPPA